MSKESEGRVDRLVNCVGIADRDEHGTNYTDDGQGGVRSEATCAVDYGCPHAFNNLLATS